MTDCFGIDLDQEYRCLHYHTPLDIVGLKCAFCQTYYACYHCYDQLTDHAFVPTGHQETSPVICGHCRKLLSLAEYGCGCYPYCQSPFNPACHRHKDIYFLKES
ncbi:TPA: CHY zinc finger protein [Streptococcus pyogenes]